MAYSTKEFVEKYAETTGITKKAAKEALDGFFATLKQIADEEGEDTKITFMGKAIFSVKKRAARTGRNPQTGEAIAIPESVGMAAKFSKSFLDD